MAGLEDNSMVGRTFAHSKADAGPKPAQSAQPSVAGRMFLAVVCGAFFGGVLSVIVAPDFAIALAIGGAMTFGACTVAYFMMSPNRADEHNNGHARTEEEVNATMARMKGDDT